MDRFILKLLQCPVCGSSLLIRDKWIGCDNCGGIDQSLGDQIDLRPTKPTVRNIQHVLDPAGYSNKGDTYFGELQPNQESSVNLEGIELHTHVTPAMATYIPSPEADASTCLDLGCGDSQYRKMMEQIGYRWIGCDFAHPKSPILADAHALPFAEKSFDFTISLAVLEHLQHPSVALREIYRTMKPGAHFLGSVTYLTPFHDSASYFNMTHEGVYSILRDAGFEVKLVAAERTYMAIHALCYGGLFLGSSRRSAYAVARVVLALSKWWWRYRRFRHMYRSDNLMELLINAGAFVFLARRPN